jgi:hypothetical protein
MPTMREQLEQLKLTFVRQYQNTRLLFYMTVRVFSEVLVTEMGISLRLALAYCYG